ncbi:MAG: geranylgeranylglycerol-phosphate geranylgeranyltransferase [Bacteroidales bacterium]|nr:geranylgeranylglycerol-phosphate geranylgeranyltransferase [Bacteroidales bacterium]
MNKFSILKDYFRLFRFGNLLFIILIQFLTLFCIIFPFINEPQLVFQTTLNSGVTFSTAFILLVLATTLIAAGGNIINDVYDVEIDSINRPEKIIIGKSIKSGTAIGIAIALDVIGSLLGIWMSIRVDFWLAGLIFPMCALGLWFYASTYKKSLLIGNLIISLFCCISILIVWLFVYLMLLRSGLDFVLLLHHSKTIHYFVWCFSGFAFLTTLIREIIKDCEDINGDTFVGCRTIPIVYGFFSTKNILFWLTFFFIFILAIAQWFLFKNDWSILGYCGFIIQFFLLRFTSKMQNTNSKEEFHQLSNRMKLIMLLGVLSMISIPVDLLI